MIEFKDTEIPTTTRMGRTPLPNPFHDLFPLDEAAKTFDVEEGKDSIEARRLVRQARQAAKQIDRTARLSVTENEDGSASFVVWTVMRKPRK